MATDAEVKLDVVERLRQGAGHEPADIATAEAAMDIAADTIESLRARNEQLAEALGEIGDLVRLAAPAMHEEALFEINMVVSQALANNQHPAGGESPEAAER